MRRRGPRPVAHALDSVTAAIAPATLLAEVQRAWPQVAGERFARAAETVAERDGVVTVACRSAVWAQELDLMGPELVGRINAALGAESVVSLRCSAAPAKGWS